MISMDATCGDSADLLERVTSLPGLVSAASPHIQTRLSHVKQ